MCCCLLLMVGHTICNWSMKVKSSLSITLKQLALR